MMTLRFEEDTTASESIAPFERDSRRGASKVFDPSLDEIMARG